MKTEDLIGPALDWAVATCEEWFVEKGTPSNEKLALEYFNYSPSTKWEQGGPIIEREKIQIEWDVLWKCWTSRDKRNGTLSFIGPTPLIAAMRVYIASKFGDEVEIPEDLL